MTEKKTIENRNLTAKNRTENPHLTILTAKFSAKFILILVSVFRFDHYTGKFRSIQKMYPTAPTIINFAALPTGELILYTLTKDPSKDFIIYLYEDLAGFSLKVSAPVLKNITNLQVFTSPNSGHYAILNSNCCSQKIRAIFKGVR